VTAINGDYREALGHYAEGRKTEAERLCLRVVDEVPGHADAWHLLGLIAHEAGRHDAALALVNRAIDLHGANPAHYNTLGLVHAALNEARTAVEKFRLATLLAPAFAEAHANLGATLRTLGDLDGAQASLLRALELKPGFTAARYDLGLVRRALGRLEEAADDLWAVLRADPKFATARSALAGVLRSLGRPLDAPDLGRAPPGAERPEALLDRANLLLIEGRAEEAIEACQRAPLLRPEFPEALGIEGVALMALGRSEEAEARFRAALRLAPDLVEAHHQLGLSLLAQRRPAEAVGVLGDLLEAVPGHAEARLSLVRVHLALGRFDEAEAGCRKAIALRPGRADARCQLALILADQGRVAEAEELLREALRLEPSDRNRVFLATLLPPIFGSTDELEARRSALAEGLDRLAREGVRVEAAPESLPTLFYLAHQGRNDRDLHRAFGRLVARPAATPLLPRPPVQGRKVRVGFFSEHFRNHTVGRLMRGVVARLPREALTVVALSDVRHDDEMGRFIARGADEFVAVSRDARAARAAIAACALDVLVYTDLGMESLTYALACSRLAPVQCLTWGHPATSGLETIDYFLSSEPLEVPGADAHYTERLVRLPTLPIYYYRPAPPTPPKGRAALGLPEEGHLYGCPQTLFKLHPEFDDLLGAILRRDPSGRLVLLHGRHPHWTELTRRRFGRTMPDVLDRVHFLPPLSYDDFLHLNAAVDVLLDPTHFGGGNTSYEALALGTPVVTLPSDFLKGRITQALYRKMGVGSCVASTPEQYVEIAVALGTDRDRHERVRAEILASCHVLFEDAAALRALESFFQDAARD
jgi:predicted O-linked N-acetylglucosamine transferase (SPINDLY family)